MQVLDDAEVVWGVTVSTTVESRLGNLYEALETKHLTLEALSPRILALRHRQDQLTGAKEEAESQLEQRRVDLPDTKEIKGYVEDIHTCLQEGTLLERKALIRNFVKSIEVVGEEATLTYTIPMPRDGVTSEGASVQEPSENPNICSASRISASRKSANSAAWRRRSSSTARALVPRYRATEARCAENSGSNETDIAFRSWRYSGGGGSSNSRG